MIEQIAPESILPPHEVMDTNKFNDLTADMLEKGWTGRPILAIQYERRYAALTGSHRIAAAVEALYEIPVYVITQAEIAEAGIENLRFSNEQDRAIFFEELGDDEASAIYAEEGE